MCSQEAESPQLSEIAERVEELAAKPGGLQLISDTMRANIIACNEAGCPKWALAVMFNIATIASKMGAIIAPLYAENVRLSEEGKPRVH